MENINLLDPDTNEKQLILTDSNTNRIAFVSYDESKETIHEYRKKTNQLNEKEE